MNHHHHATSHPHGSVARRHRAHEASHHRRLRYTTHLVRIFRHAIDRFLLFPLGALIALVWANTAPESYFRVAHAFAFPVNEIAMALFFALMAQEVFEAMMPGGGLHAWRRWSMPIVAAAGGIAASIFTYLRFVEWQYETSLAAAWPIASATDAVTTYYVVKAIFRRSGAVPFALLLAIATNVFGVIVVAPRYLSVETRVGGAGLVIAAIGLAALMRLLKVRAFWPYLFVCGTISWIAFYWEGLHPAFALVPIVPFLPHEPRTRDVFGDPADDDAVHHAEREWHAAVHVVVFLFALVNAGVVLRSYDTGSWALLTAALVGRPTGILLAIAVATAVGLHLPRNVGWRELVVVAFAASSGFLTMLFFAVGVLALGPQLAQIKIGVLLSAVGAFIAFMVARLLRVGRFAR